MVVLVLAVVNTVLRDLSAARKRLLALATPTTAVTACRYVTVSP